MQLDSLKSDIKSTSESHRDINNEQAAKFKKLLGDSRQEIVAYVDEKFIAAQQTRD